LALLQQSLYSFPDPQGHLSLGFGIEHFQLMAVDIREQGGNSMKPGDPYRSSHFAQMR